MKMEWSTPELVEFNRTARGSCVLGSGNTCSSFGSAASMGCYDGTAAGNPTPPTCDVGTSALPAGLN